MTHPTWELSVNDSAALVLMPCPGTKEASLQDSIAQLKAQGVSVVVTALSFEELAEHQVDALPEQVKKAGMAWCHAPIEDDQAPQGDFHQQWQSIYPTIEQALNQGEKVALHCMGGSGRTGLLAAHVLLAKGWALADIISQVRALRPGAFTKPLQVDYIQQFASQNAHK